LGITSGSGEEEEDEEEEDEDAEDEDAEGIGVRLRGRESRDLNANAVPDIDQDVACNWKYYTGGECVFIWAASPMGREEMARGC